MIYVTRLQNPIETLRRLSEVGLGSGALHASLDAVAQAGDELPMLYAATMLAYCCADTYLVKAGMTCSKLPWITALITLANTLLPLATELKLLLRAPRYVGSRDDFGIFAATFAAYTCVPVAYFSPSQPLCLEQDEPRLLLLAVGLRHLRRVNRGSHPLPSDPPAVLRPGC